jgi:hypothetical protein
MVPFWGKNRKKIHKKGKLNVALDRAMSNVYENNISPTLPRFLAEIHNLN